MPRRSAPDTARIDVGRGGVRLRGNGVATLGWSGCGARRRPRLTIERDPSRCPHAIRCIQAYRKLPGSHPAGGLPMKPTILRDQTVTPDGEVMTLHEHDGAFTIRVAGVVLMSTRQHHSEERLARLACEPLRGARAARVLIGGLGFGFTLRAALGILPADAGVVVAELMPEVIAWNRDPAYRLAGDALDDPRVETIVGDVADILRRRRGAYDAVILDVDNGAVGLTTTDNDRLYTADGLAQAREALRPGGTLAVWSATRDRAFAERMRRCGFDVTTERARVHAGGGSWNDLFIGRRNAR